MDVALEKRQVERAYELLAPVYDFVFDWIFAPGRSAAIKQLAVQRAYVHSGVQRRQRHPERERAGIPVRWRQAGFRAAPASHRTDNSERRRW